jgi:hypothetical protein
MTRTVFPFTAKDVSALARSLRRELEACESTPSHLQLLNMLSRSAGYRNFQHFRAQFAAQARLESDAPEEPVDHKRVEQAARHFDDQGRLATWPSRTNLQRLCLWGLWSRIPTEAVMTETQVSDRLRVLNGFGDHALLRREMFETGLLTRTPDGRQYRRVEQKPSADAAALIRHLGRRGA